IYRLTIRILPPFNHPVPTALALVRTPLLSLASSSRRGNYRSTDPPIHHLPFQIDPPFLEGPEHSADHILGGGFFDDVPSMGFNSANINVHLVSNFCAF
ncbi:MAG: hypothetical protein RL521_16, partial [Bacteroidota bacterium]